MYWGADFSVLYNDEYISFLGEKKHPYFLGRPGRECWQEIWNTIGPMLEGVCETASATWSEDLMMFFARKLPLEEVYVRFTFGPILAADGKTVDGIFCPCTETTDRVVGERRLETLRKLGVQAAQAHTVEAACRESAEALAENPYATAYEAERKRAEALAEIDRARTLFFSNISHELRTPLTLLLGPLENMLSGAQDTITAPRDELEIMRRNGLRLLKLVNNLLDFSRIEAGRVMAVTEPVQLDILTADLASVFRSAFERGGIKLTVQSNALSQPVYVDRDMWEQIVMNLLSNAFKFTLEGEVTVSLSEAEGCAVLQVRDTGSGVPADELPNLFKSCVRSKCANTRGDRHRVGSRSGVGEAPWRFGHSRKHLRRGQRFHSLDSA